MVKVNEISIYVIREYDMLDSWFCGSVFVYVYKLNKKKKRKKRISVSNTSLVYLHVVFNKTIFMALWQ